MKTIALICTLVIGTLAIAYAATDKDCQGFDSVFESMVLEPERAEAVKEILHSYKDISKLYMSGQTDQIPQFLSDKETELAQVLTEQELEQFKANVSSWASNKGFAKFADKSNWQKKWH